MTVSTKVLVDLHRRMVRVRLFEERAGKLMSDGKLPGFLHLYVGQEAVAAGVIAALRPDDQITSTHRGHGHIVAKDGDMHRMYAELFGRSTGYCHGKGGSMHISELDLGILGANGIVGGGMPIAVGAAFANRYQHTDRVSVSFFGDGASNIGAFHEACNMAAVLRLPVLFVCENNKYGEYTAQDRHQLIERVADRAAAYGFPGETVDGMDAVAVYEATARALTSIRAGNGPVLIEAETYRYYDHQGVKGLRVAYRDESEVEEWQARDAIAALESVMVKRRAMTKAGIKAVWERTAAEIDEAVDTAASDPFPQPADLLTDVYTETERVGD